MRHVGAADTDDLSRWLVAWVWHNPKAKDQVWAVRECAGRMGRRGFTETEAEDVIEEAQATPKASNADDMARWLQLDYETRQLLGVTTIGACDVNKRERRRRRRERNRLSKERQRRARGAKLRSEYEGNSVSRAKPWEAFGISRKTWYKRQKTSLDRIGR